MTIRSFTTFCICVVSSLNKADRPFHMPLCMKYSWLLVVELLQSPPPLLFARELKGFLKASYRRRWRMQWRRTSITVYNHWTRSVEYTSMKFFIPCSFGAKTLIIKKKQTMSLPANIVSSWERSCNREKCSICSSFMSVITYLFTS